MSNDKMRAAFEAAITEIGFSIKPLFWIGEDGKYRQQQLNPMWEFWQAALAAQAQEAPPWHERIQGMEVSMDVSTGDDDAGRRIYGRVNGYLLAERGNCRDAILAEEESRNFTAPASAQAAVPDGWISVKVCLPDEPINHEYTPLITAWDNGVIESAWYTGDGVWQHPDGDLDYHGFCKVTHWMPLPAAPSTQQGGGE